jgi:hypothetical protein
MFAVKVMSSLEYEVTVNKAASLKQYRGWAVVRQAATDASCIT